MNKDIVSDFLYWNPKGKRGMPHSNIYIGVEFEVGGCHEDWGFIVKEFNYNPEKDAYEKKIISSGRNLEEAINKAKKEYLREK